MYCNEKKSYTRPSGEIILRMTERESPLRKDMLYREDSRGISRIWRRRRRTAANPGDVFPCCVGCHGMGHCYSCHGKAANPGDPEDTCLPCCIGLSRDGTLLQLSWDETTICRALLSFLGLSRDTVPKL